MTFGKNRRHHTFCSRPMTAPRLLPLEQQIRLVARFVWSSVFWHDESAAKRETIPFDEFRRCFGGRWLLARPRTSSSIIESVSFTYAPTFYHGGPEFPLKSSGRLDLNLYNSTVTYFPNVWIELLPSNGLTSKIVKTCHPRGMDVFRPFPIGVYVLAPVGNWPLIRNFNFRDSSPCNHLILIASVGGIRLQNRENFRIHQKKNGPRNTGNDARKQIFSVFFFFELFTANCYFSRSPL